MTEDEKKQVAAFRFGVICDLVNGVQLAPGQQTRLIRDKCARKWQIPFSSRTHISSSTLRRWVRVYKRSNGKLESLYPQGRCDQGKSRALDEEVGLALIQLRKQMPQISVPNLINHMVQRRLASACQLRLSTVYAFLRAQGLMALPAAAHQDRRKFEAELPNDLWQSDVMHGPLVEVDGKRRKSYLIAIIDDHSRLVVHGQFYLSERLASYLNCFQSALLKRGLPRKLYVDNGAAFRARHLEHITASLGIALIHSKPYQPQGKGKIERLFRTIRADFLSTFAGRTLWDLNEAFERWVNEIYHHRTHGSTGQSPFKRFTARMECLRHAPTNLTDYFRQSARRRVAKDRTITLNGRLYEAPVPLIGQHVVLLYNPEEPESVEIQYKEQSYGMARPVDLHVNCRVKRDQLCKIELLPEPNRHGAGHLFKGDKNDE